MAVVKQYSGLQFAGTLYGGPTSEPVIRMFKPHTTRRFTAGDPVNMNSGEIELGAAASADLIGVCNLTVDAVNSTTDIPVIANADAVWAFYDTSSRDIGTRFSISSASATGALAFEVDSSTGEWFVPWDSSGDITYLMPVASHHAMRKLASNA